MTDFEPQTIPPRLDITPVRDYSQKEHPLPSEKALGLLDNIRKYKETLPDADNNRLAVIIPARRASHLLQTGLPILNRQIKECVDKEKIDGADIAIVLNRGGDEADQPFANDFQVEDVSFDIVTSGLMGKDIRLTDQVRVVYSAPADRGLSITEQLKELRIL